MFHKFLVAIDNSAIGKQIFDQAVFLAQATTANLMLLHVLSPYEEGYPGLSFADRLKCHVEMEDCLKQYQQEWEAFKEQGLIRLRQLADEATTLGVSTEFMQIPGTPDYAICHIARTWGADLIIVGSQGLLGVSELTLGSVTSYVTHQASCSVLIIDVNQFKTQEVPQTSGVAYYL